MCVCVRVHVFLFLCLCLALSLSLSPCLSLLSFSPPCLSLSLFFTSSSLCLCLCLSGSLSPCPPRPWLTVSHCPLSPGLQPEAWGWQGCSLGPSPSGAADGGECPQVASRQRSEDGACTNCSNPAGFSSSAPPWTWAAPSPGTHPPWAQWGC